MCMYAFYFIWHVDSPWPTGHLLIPQASVQRPRQMPPFNISVKCLHSTPPSNTSVQLLRQIPPSSIPNVPGTKYSCPSHRRSVPLSNTSVTPPICSVSLVALFSLSIQHLSGLCVLTEGSRSLPQRRTSRLLGGMQVLMPGLPSQSPQTHPRRKHVADCCSSRARER